MGAACSAKEQRDQTRNNQIRTGLKSKLPLGALHLVIQDPAKGVKLLPGRDTMES
jgi:hypothetical protein